MIQKIYRLPSCLELTGYSRSTLYRLISTGLWPRPVKLGARAIGWPGSEIESLTESRLAGTSEPGIRALVARLEAARKATKQGGQS